jgi:hypothetical protein
LLVINYLTAFPLFTSKYLNFLDWKSAFELFYEKEENQIEDPVIGRSRAKKLYSNVNHLERNENIKNLCQLRQAS